MSGHVGRHGPSWRAYWVDQLGKRRTKSGFRTKAEAAEYVRDRTREVKLGVAGVGMTFDDLRVEFLATHQASIATLDRIGAMLKHVTFGESLLIHVDPPMLVRWRANLPTDHIRYSATAVVKQLLSYADRMGYIERSPARFIKNPQPDSPEILPLQDWDEVARLDRYLGGVATVAVGTGLRPQEWRQLRWEHVDLHGRAIILPKSIAKTGEARRIPLRVRVLEALMDLPHRSGSVFGVSDLHNWRKRVWTPALRECKLEYRRPYEMRHTYATWALRAGVSTFLVARRMGTSLAMIDRTYGQFAVDTEAHELRLLDQFDGNEVGIDDQRSSVGDSSQLDVIIKNAC
jgi:integrase